ATVEAAATARTTGNCMGYLRRRGYATGRSRGRLPLAVPRVGKRALRLHREVPRGPEAPARAPRIRATRNATTEQATTIEPAGIPAAADLGESRTRGGSDPTRAAEWLAAEQLAQCLPVRLEEQVVLGPACCRLGDHDVR